MPHFVEQAGEISAQDFFNARIGISARGQQVGDASEAIRGVEIGEEGVYARIFARSRELATNQEQAAKSFPEVERVMFRLIGDEQS